MAKVRMAGVRLPANLVSSVDALDKRMAKLGKPFPTLPGSIPSPLALVVATGIEAISRMADRYEKEQSSAAADALLQAIRDENPRDPESSQEATHATV